MIHVDFSIPSQRVVDVMTYLKNQGKCPQSIILDNGTEFTANRPIHSLHLNKVELKFIQPEKPIQNAFIKSFNDKFRNERLNLNWFESIYHAKEVIDKDEAKVTYEIIRILKMN